MSFQEPQHEVVEPIPVPKDKSPKAKGSFNALTAIVLGYKHLPRVLLTSLILCLVALLATVIPLEVISHRKRHPRAKSVIFDPVSPPSFPLAVRNPYVSAWMPGDLVDILPRAEVQFWAGQYLTWSIAARVDGVTFNLMGVPNPTNGTKDATVTHAQYTSTHSIFTLKAGAATFELDFLSPVSPSNYLRQSLPFSYVTINAITSSGTNIQIFSDLDDTWTGQSVNSSWTLNTTTDTSIFSINANNVATYSQNSMDQALWGEVIFASRNISSNVTLQTGPQLTVRGRFATQGNLTGEIPDWTPGGITGEGGVVGIAQDLGLVTGEASVQYAIGYVREEAVNYLGSPYTGYYRATYPNTIDAVTHFFNDYEAAYAESLVVDSTISSKSIGIAGQNYSDIVALSLRQAYGGLELTIPNDTLNTSSILAFIKEISSDGNVNTVDVIFPAFPMYYAIDPEYIRLLLEPIMLYLAARRWPHSYVIHDIGSDYPNATGHDDGNAEAMPIEETGNLLILIYAYTLATNNTSWAANYTSLLQGYADYLVSNSLNISKQLSTNDAAGPLRNETNLAVKAAIGLKAFGVLTGLSNYSAIGDAHANILYTQGLATDENKTHFTLTYPNNATSWKVTFNLYPDFLLNISTFPQSAYDMGSSFYPTVRRDGGVGLDNRQWWAKTDWNLWAAGTSGNETRNMFVNDVWSMMTYGLNTWPFSDRYIVSGEGENEGRRLWGEWALRARPTVGGHFSLLALKGARYLAWGDVGDEE